MCIRDRLQPGRKLQAHRAALEWPFPGGAKSVEAGAPCCTVRGGGLVSDHRFGGELVEEE